MSSAFSLELRDDDGPFRGLYLPVSYLSYLNEVRS